MKLNTKTLAASITALAIVSAGSLIAEEGHKGHDHGEHAPHKGHDHGDHAPHKGHAKHEEAKAGPNGGKIIHTVVPHLEFFVTKDRKVQITALGEDGKAVPIAEQSIRIIGGDRSNPTRMSFKKEGDILVSDIAFPEGNNLPVVVQIKATPDAKTIIEKFNLNMNACPKCENAEYACACEHAHEDHEGHDH